jgi:asparaginyl-tRNA synthetase
LTVNGFVRTVRKQKRVAFAAIGDGSSIQTVQAVLTPEQADGLSTGIAVSITGQWKPSPGQEQAHELQADTIRILGHNDASKYPLQKKFHTAEFLRTLPHLRARLPFNALLLRLRSMITARVTNFFSTRDFIQVHPPIITSSDCEGAGEVFTVSPASSSSPEAGKEIAQANELFFQSPKYLTVSTQLHLEALAQSVGRVWSLSPTFRAEKSDTPRHLSEFYMLEAEEVFLEDLHSIMDVVEAMIRDVAIGLQSSQVGEELLAARDHDQLHEEGPSMTRALLSNRWQRLVDGPWPRITYKEAMEHLKNAEARKTVQFTFPANYLQGLQTEHERFLAETIGQGGPVFVTDYPRQLKPFYMPPSSDAPVTQEEETVACFDLLVPEICELVGGSLREHRLPELLESMEKHGVKTTSGRDSGSADSDGSLQWYLDLRRYGSVPHGGFGMGFDRLLCYLSGVSNIRDVVSFPRWHRRCDC